VPRRHIRMSASATEPSASATVALKTTPASALETATTLKTARALITAAGPLEPTSAALKPASKLLAACRTALGKGSRLSAIAGIEGRALLSKVAALGSAAKLRRAGVGALSERLGPGLPTTTPLQALTGRTVRREAVLSGRRTVLSGPPRQLASPATCSGRELTSCAARCATGTTCPKAAVVPAGGRTRGSPTKALGRCRIAIGDPLSMQRVVLPGVAANGSYD